MKAFIVCGSRRGGFTSDVCGHFAKGLGTCGVMCEIIFPIEMGIGHCTGCGECSKKGECVITDAMDVIYDRFKKSDLLVLASPIHFSGPSSAIKTVIDRFQPLWFGNSGVHPSHIAALLNGGGPLPNFKNSVSIFRAFSITAEMEWLGHLEISGTDGDGPADIGGLSFGYGKEIGNIIAGNLR